MQISKHVMTVGDVAKALGVTPMRVRQLDAALLPVRSDGNQRRYDPKHVQRVLRVRGAR